MPRRIPRRPLLAAAVPGLLAGCFEEADGTQYPSDEDGSPDTNGEGGSTTGGDDSTGVDDDPDSDGGSDGSGSDANGGADGNAGTDPEPTAPDRVDPEDAGVTVTDAEVLDVAEGGYWTTVTARLVVENDGRFTYGLLEFRADVYATRPNSRDRDAVGFDYVTERFPSGDRFAVGRRPLEVEVRFRSRDGGLRADPDWYAVDAAVRRAEPGTD